jgi:hypothetical protein
MKIGGISAKLSLHEAFFILVNFQHTLYIALENREESGTGANVSQLMSITL